MYWGWCGQNENMACTTHPLQFWGGGFIVGESNFILFYIFFFFLGGVEGHRTLKENLKLHNPILMYFRCIRSNH